MTHHQVVESAVKAALVQNYLDHTTGTESYHRHFLGLRYTDGIRYVAEMCGAYWLIDLIASHQPGIRRRLAKLEERDFQVWQLTYSGEGWVAEAWTDTPYADGSELLARQVIEYSDFPTELSCLKLYVEEAVILLPQER